MFTSPHFWSLTWWACILICNPQSGSSLWHLPSKTLWFGDNFYFSIIVSSLLLLSPRLHFHFFLDFCVLLNVFIWDSICKAASKLHLNFSWSSRFCCRSSKSGMEKTICFTPLPAWAEQLLQIMFIPYWYLQCFPIWKLTVSFLSIQPLLVLSGSQMGWYRTKSCFGQTTLSNKWLLLSQFLLSLAPTDSTGQG